MKEEIRFNDKKWVIVNKEISSAGVEFWEYKVYWKSFVFWLSKTNKKYTIFPNQWKELKSKVNQ